MSGFDPEKITFFAKTDSRGQQVPFGIKAKDRQRHMYVIGKTGMGKSTLLENMAAQDIQNGEGMAFIDPHGSAIEVLLDYIPEDRLDDVVYFAPFDMDNPVAFNIMEDVGVDTRHLVVSGLMSTFKKIWEDAWSARMEYILTNALLALIEYPDTTLLSVNRMLADKEYRDKVIENVKDPAVKAYWIDEFNNYTERFAAEALPAIQNKIGQFTGNPLIRNIIGQPKSSFDVRKMMDEKKILLINLSKGLIGETNADLIGSMLITKIYLAAMSRAELPPVQMKQMPNFYFYVDEFQSFANSTFANILSEARKYHLNLIIAHQYVAQMEEKIRDAVFGNVGTTVAFRTGPFDAEVLETVFAPQFEATDLVNLGMYQICLTLMIDEVGSPPFSAVTLPPVQTPPKSHKHMAIKRSQQNYSKPRSEVEQLVIDSHSPDERLKVAEEKGHGNNGGFTKPSGFFKVGTDKEFVKQKEQLKNGGSIKRGPAQTPPGTKSQKDSNQKQYQKNRKQSIDQNPRTKKTNEKTPDDLRAILAQLTSGTSKAAPESNKENIRGSISTSEKKERVEKVVKPDAPHKNNEVVFRKEKPLSDKQMTTENILSANSRHSPPESSRNQNHLSGKPARKQLNQTQKNKFIKTDDNSSKKTDSVEIKKDDLKSVLAALVDKSDVIHETDLSKQNPSQSKDENNHTNNDQRKDNKKSSVVPSRDAEREFNQNENKDIWQKPVVELEMQPSEQPHVYLEQAREKSAEKSKAAESEKVKQSDHDQIGGVRQPAFAPIEISEQPDIATVKQMLKTSGKERLPGAK